MSSTNHCTEQPQIIELDRYEFEHEFKPKRRFLLISIRRPGSRFTRSDAERFLISRCDVMLHEWDQVQPPYPLPPVAFQARQALRVADWLSQHIEVLAVGDCDIVIQSEQDSSQRSAISAVTESILNWSVANRGCATPHAEMRLMLEMALAIHDVAERIFSIRRRKLPIAPAVEVLGLISTVFANLNIDMIVSKDLQHGLNEPKDLATAFFAIVASLLGVDFRDSDSRLEAQEFVTGVMRLRQTQCLMSYSVVDFIKSRLDSNKHSTILYVGEVDEESVIGVHQVFPGSIQLLVATDAEISLLKSSFLHRGRCLLETRLGAVNLLSVSHHRDFESELLHSKLRMCAPSISCS